MPNRLSQRAGAMLQALFVTFLWSTSWVLIKIGLVDIPALTFSGLRYGLAFICLLPFALQPRQRAALGSLKRPQWGLLIVLGLVYYAIVQGAIYIGLSYLPSATVSLLLNFTSIFVAGMSLAWLKEAPRLQDWLGVILSITGSILYFFPVLIPAGQMIGLSIVALGVIANAGSAVLGRYTNSRTGIPVVLVTTVSMGVGAALLLLVGILAQGLPPLSWKHWLIIGWLALVNTAFAFSLWNHTLRTLSATESSIINNTMLIQIPLLAWIFLGEALTMQQWLGILIAGLGVLAIQIQRRRPVAKKQAAGSAE
jgi:drug/metabolite transporter (DMT)-like permease